MRTVAIMRLPTVPPVALRGWRAERKRTRGRAPGSAGRPLSLGAYLMLIRGGSASQYVLFVPWLNSEAFDAELS